MTGGGAARDGVARFRAVSRAASCVLAAGVGAVNCWGLDGTEFAGGALTGRLLEGGSVGCAVLAAAAAVVFWRRRVAGGMAVLGAVPCVPLYVYRLDPGVFDGWGGARSVVVGDTYVADEWAALGLVTVAVMAFAFLRPPRGGEAGGR